MEPAHMVLSHAVMRMVSAVIAPGQSGSLPLVFACPLPFLGHWQARANLVEFTLIRVNAGASLRTY
jgi:hypothetical protein